MAKTKEKAPKLPARHEVTGTQTIPLVVADRCDRHPAARALVRVVLGFSVLDFCGHCYAHNEAALIGQGFTVGHDAREMV